MKKQMLLGLALVLLLGAGCATGGKITKEETLRTAGGKQLCIRADADASGQVELYASNATQNDFSQWFGKSKLAAGEAGEELCGNLAFAVNEGDKVKINGEWSGGNRWLVENRTPDSSGSDNLREIWIDDQYYAVGKECGYEPNGEKGYDVVCTIR